MIRTGAPILVLLVAALLVSCSDGQNTSHAGAGATVTVTATAGSVSPGATSTEPAVVLRVAAGKVRRVTTPSGNIDCHLLAYSDSRAVECYLMEKDFVDPPRPKDCHLDWAPEFDLSTRASYGTCRSDANDPQRAVELAYGTAAANGPIMCTSRQSGLTCTNRQTKHGFTINRQSYEVF